MIWQTVKAGLDDGEVAEVEVLAAAAAEADGTAPFGEQVLMNLRNEAVRHVLARDYDGVLYGMAQLGDGVAELAVIPGRRRIGVGTRLVESLLAEVGDAPLNIWAHGKLPGAVALAGKFGFVAARELWQMGRPLSAPVPEPELPPEVTLRAFVVGRDEDEFLRVNNAAFDWHPEQGGWDREQLRDHEALPWFDADGFLLAVDPTGRLLGFHWTKVHSGPSPIGEVYVLGIDPAAQGRRLGRALTLAGLRHLAGRGLTDVILYVEADNTAAVRLYERLGFTLRQSDVSFRRQLPFT